MYDICTSEIIINGRIYAADENLERITEMSYTKRCSDIIQCFNPNYKRKMKVNI